MRVFIEWGGARGARAAIAVSAARASDAYERVLSASPPDSTHPGRRTTAARVRDRSTEPRRYTESALARDTVALLVSLPCAAVSEMKTKQEETEVKLQTGTFILSEKIDDTKAKKSEKEMKKEMKRLEKEKQEREKREKKAREKEKQAKKGSKVSFVFPLEFHERSPSSRSHVIAVNLLLFSALTAIVVAVTSLQRRPW